MKLINIFIIIFLSVVLFSCEETVTNVELPYVEQLVVSCVLENGDLVDSLRLERTLPPLEDYDEEKALVKDAKVKITDGEQNYELLYEDGYYRSNDLIAQAGKTYSLSIEWKGKKATASTFVPYPVEIPEILWEVKESSDMGGIWYGATPYSLTKPSKNVVYNSGYIRDHHSGYYYPSFYNISRETDVNSDGFIKVVFVDGHYFESSDISKIKKYFKDYICVLHAYDSQFYPFFITRYNGQSGDEIFGGNSNNIQWNIKGDGIGLFLGRSTTYKKI